MSLITITGPTGAGKTTLARKLESLGIRELISTTTRPPRPNEVEGDHYFFKTEEEFEITPLVESVKYGSNFYGLSEDQVLQAKTADRVAVLEPLGLAQVRSYCLKHKIPMFSVYITAEISLILNRLIARGGVPSETLDRIQNAVNEHRRWPENLYDLKRMNDTDLDLKGTCEIILDALESLK